MDLFFVICFRVTSYFSKYFSSKLSTYFEKSEFSIFAIARVKDEKSYLGLFQMFSSKLSTYFEKSKFSLLVKG